MISVNLIKGPQVFATARPGNLAACAINSFYFGFRTQQRFNHVQAIGFFNQTLARDSNFVLAAYEKCWSHAAQLQLPEAIDALKTTIKLYDQFDRCYAAVSPLCLYKEGAITPLGYLYMVHDGLSILDALVKITKNPVEGEQALKTYLADKTIPEDYKSNRVVNILLGNTRAIIELGNKAITYEPNSLLVFALMTLTATTLAPFLDSFHQSHDMAALEKIFRLCFDIVDHYILNDYERLLAVKRTMQIQLAQVFQEEGQHTKCIRLLEEFVAHDQSFAEAQQMLHSLRQFN